MNKQHKKFRSIKWGWILFISLGVLLAVITTVAMNYFQINKVLSNDNEENAKVEANHAISQIALGLEKYDTALLQLSKTVAVHVENDMPMSQLDALMDSLRKDNDEYEAVYFMDFKIGALNMSPKADFEFDVFNSNTYKTIMDKKELSWMDVYLDQSTKKLMTSVIAPVTVGNEIVGAVGIDLDFSTIGTIRTQIEQGSDTDLMILDKQGMIVSSFLDNQDGQNMNPAMSGKVEGVTDIDASLFAESLEWVTTAVNESEYVIEALDINGNHYSGQLMTMELNGWNVIALKDDAIFQAKMNSFNKSIIIALIIGMVIGVVVAIILANQIIKIVKNIRSVIDETAQGNLHVQFKNSQNNELGQLEQSYNDMLGQMRMLLTQVNDNSSNLKQVSQNVALIAHENKESLQEVANAIDEIATSANYQSEKMNDGAQVLAELAQEMEHVQQQTAEMDDESHEANQQIQEGFAKVAELQDSYTKLEHSFSRVTDMMVALNEKSQTISEVTNVIAQITDQTNLLALNASIEAARAGEHGKGFAVVADEVRNLAESSKNATTNIQTILASVLQDTSSLVQVIDETNTMSDTQKQAVVKVYEVIDELSQSIGEMSNVIQQTSGKMQEMNATKTHVVEIMNEVANLSSDVTASTEEMASAVAEQAASTAELANYTNQLNEQSEHLQQSVDRFKL